MKKIITTLLLFLSFISIYSSVEAVKKGEDVKVRVYGHVYNVDKNNPIKEISLYIKKNGKILGNSKTTKEGLFDIIINNRSDYLNLCIESNAYTRIKTIDYCVTISAFQGISRIIDDTEIREVEYDFYTNKKGDNLNQRYEDEITNKSTEKKFTEYQENINAEKEKVEKEIAEEKNKEKLKKLKEDYKMVNNTEMLGPLKAIQIIGTIKPEVGKTKDLDYNRTYIIVLDHFGNKLKEEKLGRLYDFNLTVTPKNGKVFLHPVNLKIENREYTKTNNERIKKYENEYRLITREKNIVNIQMKKKKFTELDKTLYQKETFPFLSIIFIIGLSIITIILIIKNRTHTRRKDY